MLEIEAVLFTLVIGQQVSPCTEGVISPAILVDIIQDGRCQRRSGRGTAGANGGISIVEAFGLGSGL
jgi:hypothetical protein